MNQIQALQGMYKELSQPKKKIIKVHSNFRNIDIYVEDCSCTGGISEEEVTQHGFHGAQWPIAWRIVCNDCGKQLKEIKQ